MSALVVAGQSLTPLSTDHRHNTTALLAGRPFFVDGVLPVGPFRVRKHGKVANETLEALLDGFDIAAKNKKYFDDPSTALFHCVAPLRTAAGIVAAEELALYVNLGPANANLEDFQRWAEENPSEGDDTFTTMMASSVVKILPNVVMSNLATNLDILGESTITAGSSVSSAWSLSAALRALSTAGTKAAIVGAASFPYKYFNIDSYRRFFGHTFFEPPLCEGASAVLLTREESITSTADVLGAVVRVETFRLPRDVEAGEVMAHLASLGFDTVAARLLMAPSPAGNFLAGAEPFGTLAVLAALNDEAPDATGLSITRDHFGTMSVVEVEGRRKALSRLS